MIINYMYDLSGYFMQFMEYLNMQSGGKNIYTLPVETGMHNAPALQHVSPNISNLANVQTRPHNWTADNLAVQNPTLSSQMDSFLSQIGQQPPLVRTHSDCAQHVKYKVDVK